MIASLDKGWFTGLSTLNTARLSIADASISTDMYYKHSYSVKSINQLLIRKYGLREPKKPTHISYKICFHNLFHKRFIFLPSMEPIYG